MADFMLFLFQVKSKYRRNSLYFLALILYFICLIISCIYAESTKSCKDSDCVHGRCKHDMCVCDQGWTGKSCEYCVGRVRLTSKSGYITDGAANYTLDTKCSWLIDSGHRETPIYLRFLHYATECSWDHLYVYDGDSAFAPLIAVYSGLVVTDLYGGQGEYLPEVTTHSGYAYLHFFSDAAYNMTGFNISYQIGGCPNNCSGHGTCVNQTLCTCQPGYRGLSCNIAYCPNNCSNHGRCDTSSKQCVCEESFVGADCSIDEKKGSWLTVNLASSSVKPKGRASHRTTIIGQDMWLFGGTNLGNNRFQDLAKYKFVENKWEIINPTSDVKPSRRYGHSIVTVGSSVFMYGGLIEPKNVTDELWEFDTQNGTWTFHGSMGFGVVGHTAHYIEKLKIMFVIFGHSETYGYMNAVQECDLDIVNCTRPETKGAIVKGGYGHTSVYYNNLIYIHGGYHSSAVSSYKLVDSLYSYDPELRKWRILHSSGQYRYLHSAAVISNMMLVFGGNTHNDTSMSHGAKCYSPDFLAYDFKCDKWYQLEKPNVHPDIARFGHSASVYNGKMYVFGGFNSQMLNDMYEYTPGNCEKYLDQASCLAATEGVRCVWVASAGVQCLTPEKAELLLGQKTIGKMEHHTCPPSTGNDNAKCSGFQTCPSCTETSYNCTFCDDKCVGNGQCNMEPPAVTSMSDCRARHSSECNKLHNCLACHLVDYCGWDNTDSDCYTFLHYVDGYAQRAKLADHKDEYRQKCQPPCYVHSDCENCTAASCMWCGNVKRCVESNSYVASFPYGHCLEWIINADKCPATHCSSLGTCDACHSNPMCGWCDDGSNTGLGTCREGGESGPVMKIGESVFISQSECPTRQWYFSQCPKCQCNGHSTCYKHTAICEDCRNNTQGSNCEICAPGYFGSPINGGICYPCNCHNQADMCDHETGQCYCRTKGVTGDSCEICDKENRYYGNPKGGGTCYYDLTTDYQFTFNLSKDSDKHYTQINFMNRPVTSDRDLDFTINCSANALMNVTVETHGETRVVMSEQRCTYLKTKFAYKEFNFGAGTNTTFHVYVYGFKTPIWLQISFSQFPQIDLITFFVTFFSCFISLLLIAIIIWKIKIRYVLYLSRQRMFVQMQQMASRPFGTVSITLCHSDEDVQTLEKKEPPDLRRRMKNTKPSKPSPIALEPVCNHKAAVLSLLVKLPTGDEDYSPSGQTGLAIASALVSLGSGHQRDRKNSVDYNSTIKSDKSKGNNKKSSQQQSPESTCI